VRKLLPHALLGKLVETVVLMPELLLNGHGCGMRVESDILKVHSIEDTHGALVALVPLKVLKLSRFSKDEKAESGVVHVSDETSEVFGILLRDDTSLTLLSELQLEGVLAVVLPDALEVGLVWEASGHLVGHDHVLLLDDLGSKLAKSLVLASESLLALRCAGVHAEQDVGVLVGVGEREESAFASGLIVVLEKVTLVDLPGHHGGLVVEEAGTEAAHEVLEAEPLERVRILTLTTELLGGPLSLNIVHGVHPGLTRVSIHIPAVLVLVLSPVGDAETLEDGTGTAVEADVTDALKEGLGMEILSVDVMHDIRLLVELVAVHILDAKACLSSLLDVESVGDEKEVGVDEADSLRHVLFDLRAWVEDELDPALGTLMPKVVLQGSSDLSLACEGTVNETVKECGLESWHCSLISFTCFYFFKIYYK